MPSCDFNTRTGKYSCGSSASETSGCAYSSFSNDCRATIYDTLGSCSIDNLSSPRTCSRPVRIDGATTSGCTLIGARPGTPTVQPSTNTPVPLCGAQVCQAGTRCCGGSTCIDVNQSCPQPGSCASTSCAVSQPGVPGASGLSCGSVESNNGLNPVVTTNLATGNITFDFKCPGAVWYNYGDEGYGKRGLAVFRNNSYVGRIENGNSPSSTTFTYNDPSAITNGANYAFLPYCVTDETWNNDAGSDFQKVVRDCSRFANILAAPTPTPNSPIGYHDEANCNSTWGWACDADNYNQQLDIHLYSDGAPGIGAWQGSHIANIDRGAGVAGLCGGKPNHGFDIPIPASLKDGQPHSLQAYGINIGAGNNVLLSSPQTVACILPPSNLQSGCSSTTGASATVSWNAVSGAAYYSLRVDDSPDSFQYNAGRYDTFVNEGLNGDQSINIYGTSYTFPTTPGRSFKWWVHARDAAGGWVPSSGVSGPNFSCITPPTPTNTPANTPTRTPTSIPPTPTVIPNTPTPVPTCNVTCLSSRDCAGSNPVLGVRSDSLAQVVTELICYRGFCRNSSCVDQTNCSCYISPTPTNTPVPVSRITGYKVKMPGNINVAPAASQTITLDGISTQTSNPYSFNPVTPGLHTVTASIPAVNYSVGYSFCYNATNCHSSGITQGSTVAVNTPAGGFTDLWWHYWEYTGWYRLRGASFNSQSSITNYIPPVVASYDDYDPLDQYLSVSTAGQQAAGIVLSQEGIDVGPNAQVSSTNWKRTGYTAEKRYLQNIPSFIEYARARKDIAIVTSLAQVESNRVSIYQGNLAISDNAFLTGKTNIVLIVEGDVTINVAGGILNNPLSRTSFALISTGAIKVNPAMTEIGGIFIANTIDFADGVATSATPLKVAGNVISNTPVGIKRYRPVPEYQRASLYVAAVPQMYVDLLPYLSTIIQEGRQIK